MKIKSEWTRFYLAVMFLFVLFISAFIANFPLTGKIVDTEGIKITPLNPEQRDKVEESILASEFIKDIPEKDPVFLRFFIFENGERIWKGGFLVGQNQILNEGKPTVHLSMHARYIDEFNGSDLCETIHSAAQNNDVGLYSDYSKPRLFLKYAKMLKYRNCFGF